MPVSNNPKVFIPYFKTICCRFQPFSPVSRCILNRNIPHEKDFLSYYKLCNRTGIRKRSVENRNSQQSCSMTIDLVGPNTEASDSQLSLIHISEPTRRTPISYAVFCLKKK